MCVYIYTYAHEKGIHKHVHAYGGLASMMLWVLWRFTGLYGSCRNSFEPAAEGKSVDVEGCDVSMIISLWQKLLA